MYATKRQIQTSPSKRNQTTPKARRKGSSRDIPTGLEDCDPGYLNDEITNIKEVLKENGYGEKEIEEAMKDRRRTTTNNDEREEQPTRGIVVIENIPNITPQFNRIAREHNFKVANKEW